MRLFLDTNAYSAFVAGSEEVGNAIAKSSRIIVSAIVTGELEQGFRNGSRYEQNLQILDRFLEEPQVQFAPITRSVSRQYGQLWSTLRRKGRPLPTNDIWIAAHVLDWQSHLLSSDRHFEHVPDLNWINPAGE